jgi:hypothetical protein
MIFPSKASVEIEEVGLLNTIKITIRPPGLQPLAGTSIKEQVWALAL